MSLDKAIAHGKERRKPYYKKAERDDRTCRNHGTCPWCRRNRQHRSSVRDAAAREQLRALKQGDTYDA
jgi:hypothetical protein